MFTPWSKKARETRVLRTFYYISPGIASASGIQERSGYTQYEPTVISLDVSRMAKRSGTGNGAPPKDVAWAP